MVCQHVSLPGGGHAIVCGPRAKRKLCACGRRADLLCDWKVPGKGSGTCDRPVCSSCTTSPGPDKDLCPEHAQAFAAWSATREARHG